MTEVFYKDVSHLDWEEVGNEITLQKIASKHNLSPKIVDTDWETYIGMEDLEEMNIGDMYGEDIHKIPKHIMSQIWSILWSLYWTCDIEYIDVTPYNFIESKGRVWVVDFGHARHRRKHIDKYLKSVFAKGKISKWNPDFK